MSINKNMSLLLDFYGDTLSEKQRETMELFYNDDLSLSEISEITGITRQGVRDRLLKSEQIITELENKLGLAEKLRHAETYVKKLACEAQKLSLPEEFVKDLAELENIIKE